MVFINLVKTCCFFLIIAFFFEKVNVFWLHIMRKSSPTNSTNGREIHLKLCLQSKLKFNVFQLFYSQVHILVQTSKIVRIDFDEFCDTLREAIFALSNTLLGPRRGSMKLSGTPRRVSLRDPALSDTLREAKFLLATPSRPFCAVLWNYTGPHGGCRLEPLMSSERVRFCTTK